MIVNQSGTEKGIITIGQFPDPRRFRNEVPPLRYYSSKKASVTSKNWETIIRKLNSKMQRNSPNVLLFCDNASCHKLIHELSHTKIIFMLSNTTSLIQPLDQGIIWTVMVYYKTEFIRQMVIAIDNGVKPDDFALSISVLKDLYMLKRAFLAHLPFLFASEEQILSYMFWDKNKEKLRRLTFRKLPLRSWTNSWILILEQGSGVLMD